MLRSELSDFIRSDSRLSSVVWIHLEWLDDGQSVIDAVVEIELEPNDVSERTSQYEIGRP